MLQILLPKYTHKAIYQALQLTLQQTQQDEITEKKVLEQYLQENYIGKGSHIQTMSNPLINPNLAKSFTLSSHNANAFAQYNKKGR